MKHLVQKQLQQSIATLQSVLADENIADTLVTIAKLTADAMRSGHKLLVAGNGGSAADAQHLVAEFVVRLAVNRPALRAIALTTDSSILTAAGNDYGFDHIFSRQLEALGQPGDIFLAISTSGNSRNILQALHQAKKTNITTIGFSGNNGGQMRTLCDHNIIIPSAVTMNIQESHLALEHIFCMLVEHFTFGPDFDKQPQILSE
jgi:D-sedoheptulose 7-phosphate isomerase